MEMTFWSLYSLFAIALCWWDIRFGLLPDKLTLPLLWTGLLYHLICRPLSLESAVVGAISGYLSLWLLYWMWRLLRKKEGMGYGDFKLLAALGAWHGWTSLPYIICFASLSGLAVASLKVISAQHNGSAPLCFGPFLIAGAISVSTGPSLIGYYSLICDWM